MPIGLIENKFAILSPEIMAEMVRKRKNKQLVKIEASVQKLESSQELILLQQQVILDQQRTMLELYNRSQEKEQLSQDGSKYSCCWPYAQKAALAAIGGVAGAAAKGMFNYSIEYYNK
ncbi:MAG: hypothetical protein K1060chlam5_00865 [Candidatus Anoxychlamydiales bacterium]|nr:hypothetical protein [Candidatus Anoxychlamydiales bacterium]